LASIPTPQRKKKKMEITWDDPDLFHEGKCRSLKKLLL
jgi:hypothetical protein